MSRTDKIKMAFVERGRCVLLQSHLSRIRVDVSWLLNRSIGSDGGRIAQWLDVSSGVAVLANGVLRTCDSTVKIGIKRGL